MRECELGCALACALAGLSFRPQTTQKAGRFLLRSCRKKIFVANCVLILAVLQRVPKLSGRSQQQSLIRKLPCQASVNVVLEGEDVQNAYSRSELYMLCVSTLLHRTETKSSDRNFAILPQESLPKKFGCRQVICVLVCM